MSAARSAVVAGLGAARVHTRLAALVWGVLLVVSLAAVWPAWQWWSDAIGRSLEGDRLLSGLDLAVVKEIAQYDRTRTFGLVGAAAFAAALLAVLLNPLFSAGFIGVLADREPGTPASRFLASGARHYWPFLRALVSVALAGAVVLSVVISLSTALVVRASEAGSEYAMLGLAFGEAVLAALVVLFFVAVLDVARVRLVLDDSRSALRALARAFVFVLRHLVAFAGLGLAYLVLCAALTGLVFGLQALLPGAGSWTTILVGALLWQVFAFGRIWLRMAALASEMALVRARWPVPAPVLAEESAPPATLAAPS